MLKKKKEKIKEGKSLWDDSLACGCWHLPSPAIKAKGHAAWPPTGPYHIRDTEAVLWCPSPNLSRPLSHSCHFSRERPLGPWALDYSLSLASPWRHKPTFLLICTCRCLHPHALHSTFLAGHTHQSNRPCRVNSFTCLSPWPKTLLKVEQILFTEMYQSIYWCPDLKSWDLSHKPLSHLFPTSPSSGSETLWILPSGKLHGFKPTLHTTVSAQPSKSSGFHPSSK